MEQDDAPREHDALGAAGRARRVVHLAAGVARARRRATAS
ncbi:hypothetical protein SO694_0001545 [Aureococcus anophagefferens]|uniref:Uncharacterized protein n=1 Tax=Aureococcus anophagefferens TaxID=44056 RepID=A0ABR1G2I0_AURAN